MHSHDREAPAVPHNEACRNNIMGIWVGQAAGVRHDLRRLNGNDDEEAPLEDARIAKSDERKV